MENEGVAGLQATVHHGKGAYAFACRTEGFPLGLCVVFDFSSGPRCVVYFFFSLDLGYISILVMIVCTPLGRCAQPPGTSLRIFFFLEELYALE